MMIFDRELNNKYLNRKGPINKYLLSNSNKISAKFSLPLHLAHAPSHLQFKIFSHVMRDCQALTMALHS